MQKAKLLNAIILSLCGLFMFGLILGLEDLTRLTRSFAFPCFVLLYYLKNNNEDLYFTGFLYAYAVAEFSSVFETINMDLVYYIGNMFYMLAYVFLLISLISQLNFINMLRKFPLHLIVLLVFNIYVIITLTNMTTQAFESNLYSINYLIEFVYNILVILVLSFSFINYLYQDSKKSLTLFFASLCIVFSEMLQIAYFYISDISALNTIYSLLLLIGFYFIYLYFIPNTEKKLA